VCIKRPATGGGRRMQRRDYREKRSYEYVTTTTDSEQHATYTATGVAPTKIPVHTNTFAPALATYRYMRTYMPTSPCKRGGGGAGKGGD
jgi:hypothetical protein